MTYIDLKNILLSNDVYNSVKQKEDELFELISELKKCFGFNQNNKWHIYDVYEHILHVIANVDNNICLRLAALFHDIGKPLVYTEDENGIGHFYNHWNKSLEIFKRYLGYFDLSQEEIALISNLIYWHDINIEQLEDDELERLISSFGDENISLLFNLKRADMLAQSPEFHELISVLDVQEKKLIRNKK